MGSVADRVAYICPCPGFEPMLGWSSGLTLSNVILYATAALEKEVEAEDKEEKEEETRCW